MLHCLSITLAAMFLTVASVVQSPIFAIMQSLLVSNELLQVIFNLESLLTTPEGQTFFQRRSTDRTGLPGVDILHTARGQPILQPLRRF